jgi:hypothetical protein
MKMNALPRNTGVHVPKPGQTRQLEVAQPARVDEPERAPEGDRFEPAPMPAAVKPQVDRSASWNQPGGDLAPEDLERVGSSFGETKPPQALWSDAAPSRAG